MLGLNGDVNTLRWGTQDYLKDLRVGCAAGTPEQLASTDLVHLNVLSYTRLNSPDPYLSSSLYFPEITKVGVIFELRINLNLQYFIV